MLLSRSILKKVVISGGVITATAGFYDRHIQMQMRNTKTYKRALEKVYNHEQAVELLGQPIKEGRITFKSNNNNNNNRQFSVNLKGSNTKAKLNCEFIINELDRSTELTRLLIKGNNVPNKNYVIHEA